MIKFFNPEQEARIIEAIRRAERRTSGEIRVHLEDEPKGSMMEEAVRVFRRLRMDRTQDRNGVLILLAPEKREFVILGDRGIDAKVGDNFWQQERDLLQDYFRRGEFCAGLEKAIEQIGERLRTYFPYQQDDINELSDEISYGSGQTEEHD